MEALVIITILLSATCFVESQICGRTRFGPNCSFPCNCLDRCNMTTGQCLTARGCDMGYFGASCQYMSAAHLQPATQTNTEGNRDAYKAVDGYVTTCTSTRPAVGVLWSVTFNVTKWLTWVDVIFDKNRETDMIDAYAVEGGNQHICNASQTWITSDQLRIKCSRSYNVTTMVILSKSLTPARLQLCEVYVYEGRNIAVSKNSTQMPGPMTGFPAHNANDGKTSTNFEDDSCSQTPDSACGAGVGDGTLNPAWRVAFGAVFEIYRIVVFNTRGQNMDRLRDFRVRVGLPGGYYNRIYKDGSRPPQEVTSFMVPSNLTANRLEVVLRGECRILTLCEVQVFGDCIDGKYGLLCESDCSCRNRSEICGKIDGSCLSGCADGLSGVDCKSKCPKGTYGRNCSQLCSENCMNRACNNVDGSCSCLPGWTTDTCVTPCDRGTYGEDCKESCRNCRDASCYPGNGTCMSGCERGFLGDQCTTECTETTFGWNCNETCSLNCVNQRCHGATGACAQCAEGLTGYSCEEGDSSLAVGAVVGIVVVVVLLIIVAITAFLFFQRRRRRGPPPDVVPLKDVVSYDATGEGKARVYENLNTVDNVSDTTDEIVGQVDMTIDTELDDQTLDRARLVIDDTPRKRSQVSDKANENLYIKEENHVLDVSDLPSHMTTWRESSDYLLEEFRSLPRELQASIPHKIGTKEENRKKNRYKNICAYDHSRVKLNRINDDPDSDYINACYVKGYTEKEMFIASQGPTQSMINDFIRMIWEQQVTCVVMLTNVVEEGKRKCEQYWDDGDVMSIGEFEVDVMEHEEFSHYTVRTLQISEEEDPDSKRIITQYHFTAWPDKGVPLSPWTLINFRNKVMTSGGHSGPIVAHCSAGVGRTGTFIGLDTLLRMAEEVGHVDVYDCVERMRAARVNMVQTLDQYILLHEALVLAMLLPPVRWSQNFLTDHQMDDAEMTSEFMKLSSFVGVDAVQFGERTIKASPSMMSLDGEAISQDSLKDAGLDYSGAIFISSFRHDREYMLMDTPDVVHASQFYQWMFDLNLKTLVTLDHPNAGLWPEEGQTLELSEGRVSCTEVKSDGVTITRSMIWKEEDLELEFVQLMCPDWVDSTNLSQTPQVLLDFIKSVKQTASQRPVLVTSSPSYGNGGIFCCLSLILDTIREEQIVAVPHVVSQVRACRKEVIRSMAEYKLCYDCVQRQLETEHVYSNC